MKFKPICFFTSDFLTRARQWRRGRGGGAWPPYRCDPSENCECCRNLRGEASEKVIRKSGKVLRKQL